MGDSRDGGKMTANAGVEQLVSAAQRGDRSAFSELVERYYSMVHGLALSKVGDWSAADDIAQEVFLLVWVNVKGLRQPRAFPVWLRRIARNAAINWLRSQQYRARVSEPLARRLQDKPPGTPDPAAAASRQECLDQIGEALRSLSPKLREAIVLYYVEGRTVAESAQALGIRTDTMKKRLRLGRAELRRYYERQEVPELEQLLPYSPQPYAQRILAGLAVGPAVPALGKLASAARPVLSLHHLVHGGSAAALREAGLLPWFLVPAGVVLSMLVVLFVGMGALFFQTAPGPGASIRPVLAPPADGVDYYQGTGHLNTAHWDDPQLGNYLLVERVFAGYPCDVAGVREGDRVVAVDGHPLTRAYWASHKIRGPAGVKVRVTVMRAQDDGTERELEFEITRDYVPQRVFDQALDEFMKGRQEADTPPEQN